LARGYAPFSLGPLGYGPVDDTIMHDDDALVPLLHSFITFSDFTKLVSCLSTIVKSAAASYSFW